MKRRWKSPIKPDDTVVIRVLTADREGGNVHTTEQDAVVRFVCGSHAIAFMGETPALVTPECLVRIRKAR